MHINLLTSTNTIEKLNPEQFGIVPRASINKDLIKRYLRYVRNNSSNPQIDRTVFKKYALSPAKTGMGKSRLPRVLVAGVQYLVKGLPQSRGGRRSNAFSVGYQKLKFNKKEKTQAIGEIMRWLIAENRVFIYDAELKTPKTKDFLNHLKTYESELANECTKVNLKIVATLEDTEPLALAAKNLPGFKTLTLTNNHYYKLIQGFRPHYLITTRTYLQNFVDNYILKCTST